MSRTAKSPSSVPGSAPGNGPQHATRLRTHRLARAVGLTMTAALAFGGTAAGLVLTDLSTGGTLDPDLAVTPTDLREPDPNDPFAGNALNILLVGTDMRDAENIAIAGDADGNGSDTTMLIHVSGDRTWVEVVSIPRDLLTDVPACNLPDGTQSKPKKNVQFNSAFTIGSGNFNPKTATPEEQATALNHGTACTASTVAAMTRLEITNTVAVKMNGVVGIVDALAGVEMCFDAPVVGDKKKSPGLNIEAGRHTLYGTEAIEFLRARQGTGMGLDMRSDLTRMTRQQAFIYSALDQLLEGGVLANTQKLYGVLGEVLSSIVADPSLDSVTELGGLVFSLRELDPSRIEFPSELVVDSTKQQYRVEWIDAKVEEIWERFATDQPPARLAPVIEVPDAGGQPAPQDGGSDTPDDGQGLPEGDTGAGQQNDNTQDGGGAVPDTGGQPEPQNEPELDVHGVPRPDNYLPGMCYDGWEPAGTW